MNDPRSDGCERFHAELGAYHDGVLAGLEQAEIDRHLKSCGPCRAEVARLATLDSALRSLPRIEPSAEFEAQFFARLASESQPASSRRAPARRLRWLHVGWGAAGAGAVAAAAAALIAVLNPTQDPIMTGEDWQIVSDSESFDLVLQEDPDMLYALDALEDWDDEEGQS